MIASLAAAGLVCAANELGFELFAYFAPLSALLTMLLCIAQAVTELVHTDKQPPRWSTLMRGVCSLAGMLTLAVSALILHTQPTMPNILLCFTVPVLFLLDCIVFAPKGSVRTIDPLLWILFPAAYLCFVPLFGLFGGRFPTAAADGSNVPYFFLDIKTQGIVAVIIWAAAVAAIAFAAAYAALLADRLLGRLNGVHKEDAQPQNEGQENAEPEEDTAAENHSEPTEEKTATPSADENQSTAENQTTEQDCKESKDESKPDDMTEKGSESNQ